MKDDMKVLCAGQQTLNTTKGYSIQTSTVQSLCYMLQCAGGMFLPKNCSNGKEYCVLVPHGPGCVL